MGFLDMGLSDLVGASASAYAAYRSEKNAREMQKRQVDWERERATHAHQWEVQDLKAAGLNPILSAGGSGAVTGGISAPLADYSSIGGIYGNINSSKQAKTAEKAQKAQQDLQEQQVEESKQTVKNLKIQNEILAAKAEEEKSNSATSVLKNKREQKYLKSGFGSFINYAGRGFQDVGGAIMTGLGIGGIIKGATTAAKAVRAAKSAEFAKKIAISNAEKRTYATMNGFIDR